MNTDGRPASALAERFIAVGGAGFVAAIDHLLSRNEWARNRLLMHVGRRVRIGVDALAGFPDAVITAEITDGGRLRAVGAGDQEAPAVTMRIRPSLAAMRDLAESGPAGLGRHLRLDGDVLLAAALGEIARHLRWDPAEDLSHLTGDLVAHRLDAMSTRVMQVLADSASRVAANSVRILSVESSVLPARPELQSFAQRLRDLESRIGPMEERVRRAAGKV